jgi:putative endonuclease
MSAWFVYLIRAAGGVLYAGITTDVARRLEEHGAGRGAKYLRGRGPLTVVYRRKVGDRSLALRIERRLKGLTKAEKESLVRTAPSCRRLLRMLEPVGRR